MSDKKLENNINLDTSVSEQIADMQLLHLRKCSFDRPLTYDEIKTLEILTKVKNTELEKRQPKEIDPKKANSAKLLELSKNFHLEESKKENSNDKKSSTISET